MFALPENISFWVLALCVSAAFLAGFVDAVAGGGGLIQLPILLVSFPNTALATIMGTNKSVSIVGTTAAANTYRKKLPTDRRVLIPMVSFAFLGSMGGSALVTHVDRRWFEPIILIILIAVAIFTLLRPTFGQHEKPNQEIALIKAALLGAGIGFYDGIIGPGTGMFLLFGLVSVLGATFLQASATAKFVNVATNFASLVIFIPGGHIIWLLTLLMAPANLIGGVIGARTAIDKGSYFVRAIFIVMLLVLITRFIGTLLN
jgi:uncharacterized membrane protein YfcA